MPQLSHLLLRARPSSSSSSSICRPRHPGRFVIATTIRRISSSSTSIKAPLPTTVKDGRDVVAEGLSELARAGWAGEGRVRLAVRGLEGRDAGVRVAVLGRSGSEGRLVAALLKDPLSTEPEEERRWAEHILAWSTSLQAGNNGGALLIRYGPPSAISTPPNSPLSLITVPSPLLSPSLELLLAPLPLTPEDLSTVTLPATSVPGARIIEYPVHKTLLWAGEGTQGLSILTTQAHTSTGPLLRALSLPGLSAAEAGGEAGGEGGVKIIDLPTAAHAVAQLQESAQNASTFEHEWLKSGIDAVRRWIVAGTSQPPTPQQLKPAVKTLVTSILAEAEGRLDAEEAAIVAAKRALEDTAAAAAAADAPDDLVALSRALKEWSRSAHGELRAGLDAAFDSRAWRELAWWRLPWAADDVGANAREVLEGGFLKESKGRLLFLAGRFAGAGWRAGAGVASVPVSVEEEMAQIRKTEVGVVGMGGEEYPVHVFRAVEDIRDGVIPRLQTAANGLLVKAFSVSTLGVAASVLLWLSEVGMYSAGSVGALGVVLAARGLQRGWEREKRWFRGVVEERGRVAVVETERWGWGRLRVVRGEGGEGGKVVVGRTLVGVVRRAVEKL